MYHGACERKNKHHPWTLVSIYFIAPLHCRLPIKSVQSKELSLLVADKDFDLNSLGFAHMNGGLNICKHFNQGTTIGGCSGTTDNKEYAPLENAIGSDLH